MQRTVKLVSTFVLPEQGFGFVAEELENPGSPRSLVVEFRTSNGLTQFQAHSHLEMATCVLEDGSRHDRLAFVVPFGNAPDWLDVQRRGFEGGSASWTEPVAN